MTVQQDLEKAKAAAQSALGTYSTFAVSTQDQTAQEMFKDLATDADRHVAMLNSRLNYVIQNNGLNQQQTT